MNPPKTKPGSKRSRPALLPKLVLEPGHETLKPLLLHMLKKPRSYVKTPDAARFIGCTNSQVIEAITMGLLEAHRNGLETGSGGHWQIYPASLLRFVIQRRAQPVTAPNASYLLCHVLAHHLTTEGKAALLQLLTELLSRDAKAATALGLPPPDDERTAQLFALGREQGTAKPSAGPVPQRETQAALL
jgi:hypothetical protein